MLSGGGGGDGETIQTLTGKLMITIFWEANGNIHMDLLIEAAVST